MKSKEYCPIKTHRRVYFERYDMFACLECDAWLSDPCGCPPGACCYSNEKSPRDPSMVKDKPEYF